MHWKTSKTLAFSKAVYLQKIYDVSAAELAYEIPYWIISSLRTCDDFKIVIFSLPFQHFSLHGKYYI